MSRIQKLFQHKRGKVLSLYVTAAFPSPRDTLPICEALAAAGVDMIELGMPFSDPIADGPTIQRANNQAIAAGFSLPYLFATLRYIRQVTETPILLMGHINPILQYGFAKFCSDAAQAGADGVIIPDLPPEECSSAERECLRKHSLDYVCLITSETGVERAKIIDDCASGFLYVVSSRGVTGGALTLDDDRREYLSKLRALNLKNPLVVGFGIDSPESVREVLTFADGAIVGSALIRELESTDSTTPAEKAKQFALRLRQGIRD